MSLFRRPRSLAALALLLSACGGDGETPADAGSAAGTCSVAEQAAWLATYFDERYFWYRQAPRPDPATARSHEQKVVFDVLAASLADRRHSLLARDLEDITS